MNKILKTNPVCCYTCISYRENVEGYGICHDCDKALNNKPPTITNSDWLYSHVCPDYSPLYAVDATYTLKDMRMLRFTRGG